jgi:hypothetical protein
MRVQPDRESAAITKLQACCEAPTAGLRVLLRIGDGQEQKSGRQPRCGDNPEVCSPTTEAGACGCAVWKPSTKRRSVTSSRDQ